MAEIIDITPEDSVVPVYSVTYSEEDEEYVHLEVDELSPDEKIAEIIKNRQSALAKLALLGLTEEEAKAVIGMS